MGEQPKPKRGRKWLGAGLAVVVVAVVIVVVAQGGGGSGGDPLNAIAKAAEVTQREPGGNATIEANVTVAGSPEGITETGSMSFDDHGRAEGKMSARGHSTGKEVELTVIVDGTKSYVTSPVLDSLPEGEKWEEIDFSEANPELASQSPAAGGPQEGLKVLKAVKDAEEVGKEDIEGEPTTHYRGTIDTAKKVFGVELHYEEPKVDVWIDNQDRVRRMQLSVTGSVGENPITTTTEMTIDYTEFGRVPKIEPPAASEVFDATSEVEESVQSAGEG